MLMQMCNSVFLRAGDGRVLPIVCVTDEDKPKPAWFLFYGMAGEPESVFQGFVKSYPDNLKLWVYQGKAVRRKEALRWFSKGLTQAVPLEHFLLYNRLKEVSVLTQDDRSDDVLTFELQTTQDLERMMDTLAAIPREHRCSRVVLPTNAGMPVSFRGEDKVVLLTKDNEFVAGFTDTKYLVTSEPDIDQALPMDVETANFVCAKFRLRKPQALPVSAMFGERYVIVFYRQSDNSTAYYCCSRGGKRYNTPDPTGQPVKVYYDLRQAEKDLELLQSYVGNGYVLSLQDYDEILDRVRAS